MSEYTLTTEQFAKVAGVTTSAVHTALNRRGSYAGVVPRKNASGRLLWPSDAAERLQPQERAFRKFAEVA